VQAREKCIEPLQVCITNILKGVNCPELENAALKAFLGATHHMQVQAVKFFHDWKPKFKLSDENEHLLVNFVFTRAKRFGEKTVEIQKKRKIFGK